MTILVTGGSGFIGSNFILNIIKSGNKIINLDLLTYAANLDFLKNLSENDPYEFIQGDINDYGLVREILSKYSIKTIVNFAAETHVDNSLKSPDKFIETNINGTYNLLKASKNYFDQLSNDQKSHFKFIHISTDEVYGALGLKDQSFTENSPYKPSSPYSASKAASDHLVRSWNHSYNLPTIIINCSNNYGPYQNKEKFIPQIIINALNGEKIIIYGDGKNIRDWIYVDDHCEAIMLIIKSAAIGESYNIGASCEKTNIELANLICKELDKLRPREDGKSYKEQIIFTKDRAGHDFRYSIDSTKIKNNLGWSPKIAFQQGISNTINWYIKNI